MRSGETILSQASFWLSDDIVRASACSPHAPFAFWLIEALRPKCFVEVGAIDGGFLPMFRHLIDQLGLEAICMSIAGSGDDGCTRWPGKSVPAQHESRTPAPVVELEVAQVVSPSLRRSCVDLFHIDGRRRYEDVRDDLDAWRDQLTENCVVLIHGTACRRPGCDAQKVFEELKADYSSFEFKHGEGLGILCLGRQVPEPLRMLMECDEESARSTKLACARLGEAIVDQQELRDLRAHVDMLREAIYALHRFETDPTQEGFTSLPLSIKSDPTILHVMNVRAAEREAARSAAATIRNLETELGETRAAEAAAKVGSSDLRRRIGLMRQILAGRDKAIDRLTRAGKRAERLARVKDDLRTLLARNALRDQDVAALRTKRVRRLLDLVAVSRRQVENLRRSWADERRSRISLEHRLAAIEQSRVWKQLARFRPAASRQLLPMMNLAALKNEDVILLGAIEETGLFDAAYYADQNPDVGTQELPALHFARSGWREGRRPNPDFDPSDYLERHPSVAAQGLNPLIHFAETLAELSTDTGISEDRQGCPEAAGDQRAELEACRVSGLFDPSFYEAQNPDVVADRDRLIVHYLRVGWREFRDPSAAFDTRFYLSQNPDVVAAGVNPLLHYIEVGQREGRLPKAPVPNTAGGVLPTSGLSKEERVAAETVIDTGLFDADFYRCAYPEALSDGRHPAVDFATNGWQKGRNPTASFDTAYYLDQNRNIAALGQNPLVHYADAGAAEGRHPIAEADPTHYCRPEEERLAQEILETGLFDETFYSVHNPDIIERKLNPALHFAVWGWTEGRRPHPAFDPRYYLDSNPDVAALGINPLLHYVQTGIFEERQPAAPRTDDGSTYGEYARWIAAYDTLREDDRQVLRIRQARLCHQPLTSLLMPVRNPEVRLLRRAMLSVQTQIYSNWELCISVDASTDPRVVALLREMAEADARIRLVVLEQAGGEAASSASALRLATGEFIGLVGQHDEIPEHALFVVVDNINRLPDHDILYSDEDRIDYDGERSKPYFKPDYNSELMLGHDLVGHFAVYRRSLVEKIGGFRTGYDGAQDYDVALRSIDAAGTERILHIPHILYHRRILPGEMASAQDFVGRGAASARRAVEDHLGRKGQVGDVIAHPRHPSWRRVIRARPDPAPLVSIIVPTRDRVDLLRPCCEGILQRTDYPNIELIVVDHQSTDVATLAYLSDIAHDSRVRILQFKGAFNYSSINNTAAREARGSVLALLNNDVEVIEANWLDELVALACLPEIGAVGAKLLYGDDTVQHAGIVVGINGVARHAFHLLERDDPGSFGRAVLTASVSAVTGACLVLRKDIFDRVGGLDEQSLQVAFNDVDLCLKVQALGLRNVLAAEAVLYHHESISRGHDTTPERAARFEQELTYVQRKWGKYLRSDPYYNPNLNEKSADFSLAFPPRQNHAWATND